MPDRIEEAAKALREFDDTRDAGALEQAVEALEDFDFWSVKASQRLESRHRLLLEWCRILIAIHGARQPGYDPDTARIAMNPPPPEGYPSGVSPKSIRDPAVRARYENEIKEYDKKKAEDGKQVLLVELEDRAISASHRVVERLYTTSAADQKAIDAAFEEAGLKADLRNRVRQGPNKE